MTTQLDALKSSTTVVADTGDFESMRAFTPQDATTNPSLILNAVKQTQYAPLLDDLIDEIGPLKLPVNEKITRICDQVLIAFGTRILHIVPGRVSTEVDARLSFDTQATVEKARALIDLYERHGVSRDRVLIKIASTWEGIQAAAQLEKEGISCNLTLMFCIEQAVLCAENDITLISPFVGRIYDWYKKSTGEEYSGLDDPGVQSVHQIYNYYKKFGHQTEVMGASFRNTSQILALAGCDLLTISPDLLAELQQSTEPAPCTLSPDQASEMDIAPLSLTESEFRLRMNNNPMATEKTAEGIRKFSVDIEKLEALVTDKLARSR